MVQSLEQLVTSKKKLETRNELTSLEVRRRALTIAEGLTSTEEPHDMTAWYCKAYKELGEGKYSMAASEARKGTHPQRLFGWLLKDEMSKSNG